MTVFLIYVKTFRLTFHSIHHAVVSFRRRHS